MSYPDFDLPRLMHDFGLKIENKRPLFEGVGPAVLPASTLAHFQDYGSVGASVTSEKGRSELLVSPLLMAVWRLSSRQIAVYSGLEFNVDASEGLTGVCDFR